MARTTASARRFPSARVPRGHRHEFGAAGNHRGPLGILLKRGPPIFNSSQLSGTAGAVVLSQPLAVRRSSDTDTAKDFRRFALPHLDRVYASASHLARSPDLAAELTQETFLHALRSFHQFERGTNCRAWLLTILLNVFRNHLRTSRRQGSTSDIDEPLVAAEAQGTLEPMDDPERQALWGALDGDVQTALSEVPEDFRNVVLLVDLGELTYREAASALDCPVGTIRSRLSRGRRLLGHRLREYAVRNGYLKAAK